jgi:hypothetical protein
MNTCTVFILKSIALEASLWSSAFWEYVGAAIFLLTLTGVVPSHRRALRALLGSREGYVLLPITLSGETFNLLANLSVGSAGLMAPLALVSAIAGRHRFSCSSTVSCSASFSRHLAGSAPARRQILQEVVAIGVFVW